MTCDVLREYMNVCESCSSVTVHAVSSGVVWEMWKVRVCGRCGNEGVGGAEDTDQQRSCSVLGRAPPGGLLLGRHGYHGSGVRDKCRRAYFRHNCSHATTYTRQMHKLTEDHNLTSYCGLGK